MKFKLLLAFITVILVSCSGGDDGTTAVDPTPVAGKKLDKIVQTFYTGPDSTTESTKITTTFDDNERVIEEISYNLPDEFIVKREYIYDELGMLKTAKDYYPAGGLDNPLFTESYLYDNEGKIVKEINTTNLDGGDTTVHIYTYNNNEITVNYDFGSYTFEMNADGLINKKIASFTDELEYDGDNVISWGGTSHSPTQQYEYDNIIQPKGQYINIIKNQYGSINNAIIAEGFSKAPFFGSKYVTKEIESDGQGPFTYKYEFDEEGYPIRVKYYFAQNTDPYMIKEIFYH